MSAGATRAADLEPSARIAANGNALRRTLETTAPYAALPFRMVVPHEEVPGNSRCWASTTVEGYGPERDPERLLAELEPVELTCLLGAGHPPPCGWAHVEELEPELGDCERGPWWLEAGGYPHPVPVAMPSILEL